MGKGESFVVMGLLAVVASYATPWAWWVDVIVLVVLFAVGTAINKHEKRNNPTW